MRGGRVGLRGRVGLVGLTAVSGVLFLASIAWACTLSMAGQVWLTGPIGGLSNGCPAADEPGDRASAFTVGDVACVQARNLSRSNGLTPGDGAGTDQQYELRYSPAAGGDDPGSLCHNSRLTLQNYGGGSGSPQPYFTATNGGNGSTAPRGGWQNQKTVLTMAPGSWVVCAAQVVSQVAVVETGSWDNGPDDDGIHATISVTVL